MDLLSLLSFFSLWLHLCSCPASLHVHRLSLCGRFRLFLLIFCASLSICDLSLDVLVTFCACCVSCLFSVFVVALFLFVFRLHAFIAVLSSSVVIFEFPSSPDVS